MLRRNVRDPLPAGGVLSAASFRQMEVLGRPTEGPWRWKPEQTIAAVIHLDDPLVGDQREDILRIFPPAKSLVSLAARMNRENIRCLSRDVSDLEFIRAFRYIEAETGHATPRSDEA